MDEAVHEGDGQVLADVLAACDVGLVVLDEELRFTYVNAAAEEINGVSAAEHLGCRLADVLPGIPLEFHEALRACLASGVPLLRYEVVGRTPRSTAVRQWNVNAVRMASSTGRPGRVAVVFIETTELRRAERRLRQLMDGLFSFVGLCTPDGKLIEANSAALEAGGLTADDVLGRPFWQTYWWSHDAAVQEQLRLALARAASGEPSRYDVRVRLAGDRLITIDFQLVPIVDDGEVVAIVPSALDITDRIEAIRRMSQLASLSTALSGIVGTEDIVLGIIEQVEHVIDADFVNVALLDDERRTMHLRHPDSMDRAMAATWSALDLHGPATPFHDAIRTKSIVRVADRQERSDRYPHMVVDNDAVGLVTTFAVPLVDGDDVLGALGIGWKRPLEEDEELHARLLLIGQICASALRRAGHTDAAAALVAHLTTHLLPQATAVPRLDIAVQYAPASSHLQFGGDWHDVIRIDDDCTALIVGDIVGHGVEAAAGMAVTRSLVRALVVADPTLEHLASKLATAVGRSGDYVGTAAVCVINARYGTLTALHFGHPPVITATGRGRARPVRGGRTLPIGLATEPAAPAQVPFPPGSSVMLYTDGLVELRDRELDERVDELRAAMTSPASATAQQRLDQVLSSAPPAARRDDIAIVIARLPPHPS